LTAFELVEESSKCPLSWTRKSTAFGGTGESLRISVYVNLFAHIPSSDRKPDRKCHSRPPPIGDELSKLGALEWIRLIEMRQCVQNH